MSERALRTNPMGLLRLVAVALFMAGAYVGDGTYDDGHPTLGMVVFLVMVGFTVGLLIVDAVLRVRMAAALIKYEDRKD